MKPTTLILIALLLTPLAALRAGEAQIENDLYAIKADAETLVFSIFHKPSNRTCIRDGRLRHDGGSATVGDVAHLVLGQGKAITVDVPTAETVRMAVYPGLPFVVFDSTLRNPTKDPADLHALALFTAELVTGAGTSVIVSGPATEPLGGLNKTYNTFAALLPFIQQHGAVAGWVTHDRGSGRNCHQRRREEGDPPAAPGLRHPAPKAGHGDDRRNLRAGMVRRRARRTRTVRRPDQAHLSAAQDGRPLHGVRDRQHQLHRGHQRLERCGVQGSREDQHRDFPCRA